MSLGCLQWPKMDSGLRRNDGGCGNDDLKVVSVIFVPMTERRGRFMTTNPFYLPLSAQDVRGDMLPIHQRLLQAVRHECRLLVGHAVDDDADGAVLGSDPDAGAAGVELGSHLLRRLADD